MPSLFQRPYIGGGLAGSRRRSRLSLTEISVGDVRQASDGWHVVSRIRRIEHPL